MRFENGKDNGYKYPKEQYVHCKWCNWKCLKFYKNRKGRTVSGFKKLEFHVTYHHLHDMLREHEQMSIGKGF